MLKERQKYLYGNKGVVKYLGNICAYVFLVICIAAALFPAIWMVLSSVKPTSELFVSPPRFFTELPTFSNFSRVLFETSIPRSFINSFFIAVITTGATLIISLLAGYGFSRFEFKGNKTLSASLLFGQMMPAIVLLLPLYKIYSRLNLIDTYQVNIISNIALNIPMAVMTLTAFLSGVPKELDEAGLIDGCNRLSALFQILVPVITPGIVTVCIYTFLNTWEEFIFAFNFTNSVKYKTLSIALKEFKGQFVIDWGGMMSAAVVISVPVLLIFLLCNKYFIKGITSGAVKG